MARILVLAVVSLLVALSSIAAGEPNSPPRRLIGYTEHRTDLPGGQTANWITRRAFVVYADGTGRREVAPQLATKPNTWTQFAGWSPDGKQAILLSLWESPENAAWEEANQQFRFSIDGWLVDCHLVDLASGKATNLTAVERVSNYNTGLFFWPGDAAQAWIHAAHWWPVASVRHVALDGTGKQDLAAQAGFAYGFSASPDGSRIAYHQNYQVYLADADGQNTTKVETGHPFCFVPLWSPDGQWVEFLSGEHYNCHPHVVKRDGTALRKLADRGGYRGVMEYLDVPSFHSAGSDIPSWSADSKWVYYTAKVGEAVELMRVSLGGQAEQLTHSAPGVLHYNPKVSPEGAWVMFGSTRDGVRQLWVAKADGRNAQPVTSLTKDHAAYSASWQTGP